MSSCCFSRRAILRPGYLAIAPCLALALVSSPAAGQSRPTRTERALAPLVGDWEMRGVVQGDSVRYRMRAAAVLGGQFIDLHMLDVATPPQYEARVSLGVDSTGRGLIAHWLDSFGALSSIPHGTGRVSGDTIRFVVPYPTGRFRDTFVYRRAADEWRFLLESEETPGKWRTFADYRVRRSARR